MCLNSVYFAALFGNAATQFRLFQMKPALMIHGFDK